VIDLVDWSLLVLTELKNLGDAGDRRLRHGLLLARIPEAVADRRREDRSCFRGRLGTDGRDAVIIEAVVSLAHALQLKVAAAGVETSRQLEWLRTLGCDYGKATSGHPLPAADLERWLSRS